MNNKEYIIEFHTIGNYVKVSAIDPETYMEASIVGDASAPEAKLKKLAIQKLLYVMNKKNNNSGFTLIELSIVLVIIGLLTAGMLVGKDLILQSSIRSVINDYSTYRTYVETFQESYKYYPGDYPDASDIWGTDCSATASDCDGDGDGLIEFPSGDDDDVESFRAWQHLVLAEVASGSYTGTGSQVEFRVNVPQAAVDRAGFSFYNDGSDSFISMGKASPLTSNVTRGAAVRGQDAKYLDNKIDDGLANAGFVRGDNIDTIGDCISGAVYQNTDNNNLVCSLLFRLNEWR